MTPKTAIASIVIDLDDIPFEESPPPLRILELAAELEKALAEKRAARKAREKTRRVN